MATLKLLSREAVDCIWTARSHKADTENCLFPKQFFAPVAPFPPQLRTQLSFGFLFPSAEQCGRRFVPDLGE
jgi:hypothetical protein